MHITDTQRPVIKVCGITTLQDAENAVASGATALGFNFYSKSSRYVSVERAHEIARCLPPNVVKVGVFVNARAEELSATSAIVPLDVLQLYGEMPARIQNLRIWRSMPVDKNFNLSAVSNSYEAYLLDAPSLDFGGSGRTFDWSLAAASNPSARLIVAGGLDASNVASVIDTLHPWGVDACSRLESLPGRKDHLKVRAFVAAAQAAFGRLSAASAQS